MQGLICGHGRGGVTLCDLVPYVIGVCKDLVPCHMECTCLAICKSQGPRVKSAVVSLLGRARLLVYD